MFSDFDIKVFVALSHVPEMSQDFGYRGLQCQKFIYTKISFGDNVFTYTLNIRNGVKWS